MAQLRHPNRATYHRGVKSVGQLETLRTVSRAAYTSGYTPPSPRTILVRVKGKQEPFDPALMCYWMNGRGRPNVYYTLSV